MTTLESVTSLAAELFPEPDYVIEESYLTPDCSGLNLDDLEEPPATLEESAKLLDPPVAQTTVRTRIILISNECYIPLEDLAIVQSNADGSGFRMVGLTKIGWYFLKKLPCKKGKVRDAFYDWVDEVYPELVRKSSVETKSVESVVVDEELTASDFGAIVARRIESLALPVNDSVLVSPFSTSDIGALNDLAFAMGQQMGKGIVGRIREGLNTGIQAEKAALREEMLHGMGGGV